MLRIRRRDLQAVEEDAGAPGVELIGGESLENVTEGELNGRAARDGRKGERWVMTGFAAREVAGRARRVLASVFLRWVIFAGVGRCCCQA